MKLVIKEPFLTSLFSQEKDTLLRDLTRKEKKPVDESRVEFFIEYGQMIKTLSLRDILSGKKSEDTNSFNPSSYCFAGLIAKLGRKQSRIDPITEPQKEYVLSLIKEEFDQMMKEKEETQRAYDLLSEEEKDAQLQRSLSQLRKSPGFMEIQIPIKKSK